MVLLNIHFYNRHLTSQSDDQHYHITIHIFHYKVPHCKWWPSQSYCLIHYIFTIITLLLLPNYPPLQTPQSVQLSVTCSHIYPGPLFHPPWSACHHFTSLTVHKPFSLVLSISFCLQQQQPVATTKRTNNQRTRGLPYCGRAGACVRHSRREVELGGPPVHAESKCRGGSS